MQESRTQGCEEGKDSTTINYFPVVNADDIQSSPTALLLLCMAVCRHILCWRFELYQCLHKPECHYGPVTGDSCRWATGGCLAEQQDVFTSVSLT